MLEVITWKWFRPNYRSSFGAKEVNIAQRMWARNLKIPHRFTCVTDNAAGIDPHVRVIDIKSLPSYKWFNVPNPSSRMNPSCYVRMEIYSEAARQIFCADKFLSVDLDILLVDDVTPIFDIDVDFAIWGGQNVQPNVQKVYNWFNGSVQMVKAGARVEVYNDFDPASSPQKANAAGCRGSDQGWIAYRLQNKGHLWDTKDGIFSYRNHILPGGGRLPKGARLVAFHGAHDPWDRDVQTRHSWVREHYR